MIEACARRAGAIDRDGRVLDNEAARIVAVIGVTPGETPDARAFRAARVNTEMLLAALGPRMSRLWAYGRQSGTTYENTAATSPDEYDPDEVACPTGGCAEKQTNLRLGSWVRKRLEGLVGKYRDEDGVVQDAKMVADLMNAGLRDPALPDVLDRYRRLMAPLKSEMLKFERSIVGALESLRERWAKMARVRAA